MEERKSKKRPRVTDPIQKRLWNLDDRNPREYPEVVKLRTKKIEEMAYHFAKGLSFMLEAEGKDNVDYGRMIAAIDKIQEAKNTAIDAIRLNRAHDDQLEAFGYEK